MVKLWDAFFFLKVVKEYPGAQSGLAAHDARRFEQQAGCREGTGGNVQQSRLPAITAVVLGKGSQCGRITQDRRMLYAKGEERDQGWQGRWGARGAGRQKAAPPAGARGAAKFRGRLDSKPTFWM